MGEKRHVMAETRARGRPLAQPRLLDESDERFRLLVEGVRDYAIFMLDPNGYVVSWNAGAERIKGYRAEEILGQHFSRFYPSEEAAEKPPRELEIAARTGKYEEEGWRIRKDGSRFWASVLITALHDKTGRLRGFGKVTRDLTERQRAQEETRARMAAEEAVRLRDEFLSVAAHELKTPVTGLLGQAQLSRRRLSREGALEPARADAAFAIIELQARKLAQLINQLLDISRINAGKLSVECAPTDLTRLVVDGVTLVQGGADEVHITVAAQKPVWANVDGPRVEQVVANLLSNAIKFSPHGGEIEVVVDEPAPDTVRLSVRDHGVGIPPERRPHIFDRFFQAHGEGHLGGMGLGLFICREIVELHGGQIAAEFPDDGGTRFVVTLPKGDVGSAAESESSG